MVFYCDQLVKGGFFFCKVYDAGQVIVKYMSFFVSVNQLVFFNSKFMYLIGFRLVYMVIFKKFCKDYEVLLKQCLLK